MVSDAMLLTRALAALGNGDETAELRALLRARLDSCGRFLQEDPRELDLRELLGVMVPDEQAPKALRIFTDAFFAQTAETYEEGTPFLLRMVVRRLEPGPIRVLINGIEELVAGEGRACILHNPLLLVPGMMVQTEPSNLLLLGQRLTHSEAMHEYARQVRSW